MSHDRRPRGLGTASRGKARAQGGGRSYPVRSQTGQNKQVCGWDGVSGIGEAQAGAGPCSSLGGQTPPTALPSGVKSSRPPPRPPRPPTTAGAPPPAHQAAQEAGRVVLQQGLQLLQRQSLHVPLPGRILVVAADQLDEGFLQRGVRHGGQAPAGTAAALGCRRSSWGQGEPGRAEQHLVWARPPPGALPPRIFPPSRPSSDPSQRGSVSWSPGGSATHSQDAGSVPSRRLRASEDRSCALPPTRLGPSVACPPSRLSRRGADLWRGAAAAPNTAPACGVSERLPSTRAAGRCVSRGPATTSHVPPFLGASDVGSRAGGFSQAHRQRLSLNCIREMTSHSVCFL